MGDLYALDFDGVLCDSCGESSLSAVKVLVLLLFRNRFGFIENKEKDEISDCAKLFSLFSWRPNSGLGLNRVNYGLVLFSFAGC